MLSFVQNKHNAVVNFVLIFQGRILQQTHIGYKGIVALYQCCSTQRQLSQSTNPTISLPQMNNIMMECDTVIANYPAMANHSTSFRSCLA